jgi:hypothetical protein
MEEPIAFPTNAAFKAFAARHEDANRWLRSNDVSSRLARILAKQQDPTSPVKVLFTSNRRRRDILKRYYGRYGGSGRSEQATVADFLLDLGLGWESTLESVIVQETGALEMFIREWVLVAVRQAITASKSTSTGRVAELTNVATDIQSKPYRTVSLTQVSKLFPALRLALELTHLRTNRPFLSPLSGEITCRASVDLWREVRNLILHHDRIVHAKFYDEYGKLWLTLQQESRDRGVKLVPSRCHIGKPLPLVARHAVFCLTSCYQAAVVLNLAAGGTEA